MRIEAEIAKKRNEREEKETIEERYVFYEIANANADSDCKKCGGKGFVNRKNKKVGFCKCAEKNITSNPDIFCICYDCEKPINCNIKICPACGKEYHTFCYGNDYHCKDCIEYGVIHR